MTQISSLVGSLRTLMLQVANTSLPVTLSAHSPILPFGVRSFTTSVFVAQSTLTCFQISLSQTSSLPPPKPKPLIFAPSIVTFTSYSSCPCSVTTQSFTTSSSQLSTGRLSTERASSKNAFADTGGLMSSNEPEMMLNAPWS